MGIHLDIIPRDLYSEDLDESVSIIEYDSFFYNSISNNKLKNDYIVYKNLLSSYNEYSSNMICRHSRCQKKI